MPRSPRMTKRKLDQIEQALAKDDPRFAETVNIDRWRRRRIVLAGAAFTIGIVVLLVGLVITQARCWRNRLWRP